MKIDQLPKISYILGSFIRDASDVVPEDEHGRRAIAVAADFLDIDHCTVSNPSDLIKPGPAFALDFLRTFAFAAQEYISG